MDHAPTWDWSALASEFLAHSTEFDRRNSGSASTANGGDNGQSARDANAPSANR